MRMSFFIPIMVLVRQMAYLNFEQYCQIDSIKISVNLQYVLYIYININLYLD